MSKPVWTPFEPGDQFVVGYGMTATVVEVLRVLKPGIYEVAIGRRSTMTEKFLFGLRRINR